MDYAELCRIYEELESSPKSLDKVHIISMFLGNIKKNPEYIHLLKGNIYPDYDTKELGVSLQLMIKSISKASGFNEKEVVLEFKKIGDLGNVAFNLLGKKKMQMSLFSEKLTVDKIIKNIVKMSELEGGGTVSSKINLIVDLLHSASTLEAKFIVRTILSDLKIGVGDAIIRDAIVNFYYKPETIEEKKAHANRIQELYDITIDWGMLFEKILKKELDKITLSPGKPVKVMLYPKVKTIERAFEIVGKPAAFEYKYDGFRVMINKDSSGGVKLFTRRLEEISLQFPDIIKEVKNNIKAKSFIIDAEVVGYDRGTKEYTNFQAISQRIKRKYEIEKIIEILPVELKVFDIIYFEGENLINKEYLYRRRLLEKIIIESEYKVNLAKQIITDDKKVALDFFNKALNDNQEGVMVKGLDKPYKPGARVGYGVKLKPKDNDLDLVIIGAEWGTGKRAGWFTSFDLACRSEDDLLEIGKVSTGLKEKEEGLSFEELTQLLKKIIISEKGRKVRVKPKLVVSVEYQNVQKSPTYSSGLALRFPRIVSLRLDRNIEDIAELEEIMEQQV